MSLRTAASALCPSHKAKGAVLDRYSAIHSFFRQQHTSILPKAQPAPFARASHTRQTRRGITFRESIRGPVLICHFHDTFSTAKRPRKQLSAQATDKRNAEAFPEPEILEDTPPPSIHSTSLETAKSTEEAQPVPAAPPHTERIYVPPNHTENYSDFFKRLALSIPHLQRPTRDDFLNVASGFWQRARIRFKWFTIKSFRKFNADDMSAFITLVVMSQTLWILVGTTTFFSVVFAIANSLQLQRYIARAISDYLTSETGVSVIFESAIVPKWKDSRISFKNVYISRRPPSTDFASSLGSKAAAHKAAVGYDVSSHPAYHHVEDDEEELVTTKAEQEVNWSMFDLNIDSVDVTLSLWRWHDGKGLIEDAVIKGVRGVLDRRQVEWDPSLDPALFRHPARVGDFELESLQLEDVLITVYQPGNFRPYTASIFRAEFKQFRKQWLFYDFLSAENIVGQFDNCLFSLHKPQSIGRTTEMDLRDGDWARMSRIRIDGVNIDHLQGSTSTEGPISWITSGKLDAVLDIKFPRDPHEDIAFNAILGEIADAITTTLAGDDPALKRIPGQRELAKPPLTAPNGENENADKSRVVIDIDLRFRDLKAAVPILNNDLSYTNKALIRPIVAFMNANRTLVPIHCRVIKNLADFDGSWTMWETGLMDEISLKTYDALAYHVMQSNMNRRIKTVSIWSLQMTASAVLSALRNVLDPMSEQVRTAYMKAAEVSGDEIFESMSATVGV